MKKDSNNKKLYYIGGIVAVVIIVIIILLLTSCNKGYKIELTVDNDLFYQANIHKGDTLEGVKVPTKEGYTFEGWYLDGEKFDITTPIEEDLKLEARFTKNKYTVTFEYDNGKEDSKLEVEYGSTIEEPKKPTKKGYTFAGWYNGNEKYDFNTQVKSNLTLTAKWSEISTTSYTVEHYLMGLDGKYTEVNEKETFNGKIGSIVSPSVKSYPGFTSPSVENVKVLEDGKLVVKYYYARNKYTLTVNGDKGVSNTTGTGEYYYGETVKVGYSLNAGYTFKNYSEELENDSFVMGAGNKTINVSTIANDNTPYTVEHYLMNIDGEHYTLKDTDKLSGTTDSKVTPEVKDYTGFSAPQKEEVTVLGDGKLVVKYYYSRNRYTLTITGDKGVSSIIGSGEYYYGETVKVGYSLNAGYTFKNYSEELKNDSFVMGAENKTINVLTIANENTPYTVEHYLMDIDGEHYTLKDTDKLTGTTDSKVTPEVKDYTGFSAPQKEEVTVLGDGKLVVKYYYSRNRYTLTVNGDKGVSSTIGSGEYYYEEKVNVEVALKPGYEFTKWSNEETTNKITVTIGAEDIELKASTKIIEYGITYKLNDGEVTGDLPESYTVEDKIEIEKPTKAGYSFDYFTVNGEKIDGNVIEPNTITGDIEIEAFYKANEDTPYTVLHVFMDTEGNYANVQNVSDCTEANLCKIEKHEGTTDSTVDAPLLENIEAGFTSPEELKQVTIKADGSAVVIYNYSRNRYTLTVTGDKGVSSTVGGGEYYYEEVVENISYTLNEGYEFVKYSEELDNNSYKMGAESKEITITTKPIDYEIKYDLDDGDLASDVTNPSTYTIESEIELNSPSKVGYEFAGWEIENDNDEEHVTMLENNTITGRIGNLELKATYTPREDTEYTVLHVFMDTEGKYADVQNVSDCTDKNLCKIEKHQGTTDSTVEAPLLKSFDSWFIAPESLEQVTIKADGSAVVIYKYERRKYFFSLARRGDALSYLVLKLNGEKINGNPYIYYGAEFTVEASFDDRYPIHFEVNDPNWTKDSANKITYKGKMDKTSLQSTLNLYRDTYTIIFHGNNGLTSDLQESYSQVVKVAINRDYPRLMANKFTHAGYKFLGWSDIEGATNARYSEEYFNQEDGTFTLPNDLATQNGAKVDLYAIWSADRNTVTFKRNDKTNVNHREYSSQNYESKIQQPDAPERAGYKFEGWYKTCTSDTVCVEDSKWDFEKNTMPDDALVLYAKWTANTNTKYTVEYYYMDINGKYITDEEIEQAEDNLDSIKERFVRSEGTGTTDQPTGFEPDTTKVGFEDPVLKESENGETLELSEVTINGDETTVLKFYYARKKAKITVNKDAGVSSVELTPQKNEYYYGEQIQVTAKANQGYHLIKYGTAAEKVTNDNFTYSVNDSNNQTIEIKSEGHTFIIKYYNDDSTTSNLMGSDTFTYGSSEIKLKQNQFEKEPYKLTIENYDGPGKSKILEYSHTFSHWLDKETETIYQADSSNITDFIPDSCNDELNLYVVYNTSKNNLTKPQDRIGYTFKGFKDGEEFINENSYNNYIITGNKTIEAIWELNQYNITYGKYTGNCTDCSPKTYNVNEDISLPTLERAGYTFNGWIINGSGNPVNSIKGIEYHTDIVLTTNESSWTPNNTNYKIEYYLMDTKGVYPDSASETQSKQGLTDSIIEFTPDSKEGFEAAVLKDSAEGNIISDKVTISGDGNTVLKYYYQRKKFQLNINVGKGILSAQKSGLYYFEEVVALNTEVKTGYHDAVWTGGTVSGDTYKMTSSGTQNLSVTATANTYTLKYYPNGDKTQSLVSVKCTYDENCNLANFEKTKYNVTYHNIDAKNGDMPAVKENDPYIKSCTFNKDSDCTKAISKNSNTYVAKNVTSENNADITLDITWVSNLVIPDDLEDYAFGGWSLDPVVPESDASKVIIGYNAEKANKRFVTDYDYATYYTIDKNIDLYAYWWERPFINSVSFDLKSTTPDLDGTTYSKVQTSEVVLGNIEGKKKKPLYVKIPYRNDIFVDIFSLAVGTDTEIKLNTMATPSEEFVDIYSSKRNDGYYVNLTSAAMPFNYNPLTKKWEAKRGEDGGNLSGLPDAFLATLLTGELFPTLFTTIFGENPLAVVDQFGCNGLACSYHYVSAYYQLNGDAYYFFSTEDAMQEDKLYTINYNINGKTIYTIKVPEGTAIPNIGKTVNTYQINEDFTIQIGGSADDSSHPYLVKDSYTVTEWENYDFEHETYYATGENHIININGKGSKTISLNKEQYKMEVPTKDVYLDKEKYIEETQNVGE